MCENHRLTVRSIAEQIKIDRETVRKILTEDLDMRKVCEKWSQRSSPKNKSKEESQFAKTSWRQNDILGRVITGDETCVYQYDPETKRVSAKWKTANSPRPKILLFQIKSQNNVAEFFSIGGIVHNKFVPTGQTVNQVYYLEVLKRLRENVRRKRPEY